MQTYQNQKCVYSLNITFFMLPKFNFANWLILRKVEYILNKVDIKLIKERACKIMPHW